jgi:large exoprotein involved in heme utilization and adhesion
MWPITWGERHWRRTGALYESQRINALTKAALRLQFAGGIALSAAGAVLLAKAIVTGFIPGAQALAYVEGVGAAKLIAGGLAISGIASAFSHG